MKRVKTAIAEVFSKPRYVALAALAAFSLFAFNLLLPNYALIIGRPSLTHHLLFGAIQMLTAYSGTLLVLLALSTGILLAMNIFVLRRQLAGATAGGAGLVMSILAPSCPSCAIGALGLTGMGGLFALLPFKGAEVAPLALILVIAGIVYLSRKVTTTTCSLPRRSWSAQSEKKKR